MKQVECSKCSAIVDIDGCRVREEEVESARAGGSWSLGGSISKSIFGSSSSGKGRRKSGGIRYNTGRQYYKKVKVYTCPDCAGWGDGQVVKVKTRRPQTSDALLATFDLDESSVAIKESTPASKADYIVGSIMMLTMLIGVGGAFWYSVWLGCFVLFLCFWFLGKAVS